MSLDIRLIDAPCPYCGKGDEMFSANITHNLGPMANEAGIYEIVWRSEENGIEKAQQLIEPLRKAIAEMKADPERFKKHNSKNEWGMYENFVPWLERLLKACENMPDAKVEAWR